MQYIRQLAARTLNAHLVSRCASGLRISAVMLLQAISQLDRPCANIMVQQRPAAGTPAIVKSRFVEAVRELLESRQEDEMHREPQHRTRLEFPEPPSGMHGSLAAGDAAAALVLLWLFDRCCCCWICTMRPTRNATQRMCHAGEWTEDARRVREVLLGLPEAASKAQEPPAWARHAHASALHAACEMQCSGLKLRCRTPEQHLALSSRIQQVAASQGLNASQVSAITQGLLSTFTLWQMR